MEEEGEEGSCSYSTEMTRLPARLTETTRQLNDTLFELYKPLPGGGPRTQIIFFPGLKLGNDYAPHLNTWISEDDSTLWPQTRLVKDFPGAEVLTVAYSSELLPNSRYGEVAMYILVENIVYDLLQHRNFGQNPICPIVLVGHSFGGLVMKELCVQLASRDTDEGEFFLNAVRGFFFYSTPHAGIGNVRGFAHFANHSPLLEYVETLCYRMANINSEFERLVRSYEWQIAGVGEGLPTKLDPFFPAFLVVPEASARFGLETFTVIATADHFTVTKTSASFSLLVEFLRRLKRRTIATYVRQLKAELRDVKTNSTTSLGKRLRDVETNSITTLGKRLTGVETNIVTVIQSQGPLILDVKANMDARMNDMQMRQSRDTQMLLSLGMQIQSSLVQMQSRLEAKLDEVMGSVAGSQDLPRLPYFSNKEVGFLHQLDALIQIGKALKLHFMCENPSQPHYVIGQTGFPLVNLLPKKAYKKLRPLIRRSIKVLFILAKAGLHVAAGIGNVIPDIQMWPGAEALGGTGLAGELLIDTFPGIPTNQTIDASVADAWAWIQIVMGPVKAKGEISARFQLYQVQYKSNMQSSFLTEHWRSFWVCEKCRHEANQANLLRE